MNLLIGVIYVFIAQILTFLQLQGNIKYHIYDKYPFWTLAASIPIAWFYIKSVERIVEWYNGEIYQSRLIGFSIGIFVFAIMAWTMFNEPILPRTAISLMLAFAILIIQLYWR